MAAIQMGRRRRSPKADSEDWDASEGLTIAFNAKARSCAEWNRSPGFFSRQWTVTRSSSAGISFAKDPSGSGSSFKVAASASPADGLAKARRPDNIS